MFLGTLKASSWLKLLLGKKHLLESIHDMFLRRVLLGLGLLALNLSLCHHQSPFPLELLSFA
jgi:hypothetical protein